MITMHTMHIISTALERIAQIDLLATSAAFCISASSEYTLDLKICPDHGPCAYSSTMNFLSIFADDIITSEHLGWKLASGSVGLSGPPTPSLMTFTNSF